MLRVKNFDPQWGYGPGANRFGRTISIILVATAIGAISGGGVVLSLVDLPTGRASARAHTLAAPVQALIEAAQPNPSMDSGANGRLRAAPADIAPLAEVALNQASARADTLAAPVQALISAPEAPQPNPQPVVEPSMDSGADDRLGAAVNETSTNPKVVEPAGIAPLTEVGPNDASVKVATPPSAAAALAENKTTKNRRVARRAEPRVARGGYGAWGWGGSASHLY
jgi:hypothetical protein